ncbi:hypothetical protein OG302_37185 [Streptomyces sp. NBC_01283]|uniref:hypothetical protein n=1 Tax=Streptomyces sp. NBC_01283 TaxID=2903812 RepID=UPI00352D85C9|nr:hypothetical protein OG302_37185 [Streptomyces sp. NBC_01283]
MTRTNGSLCPPLLEVAMEGERPGPRAERQPGEPPSPTHRAHRLRHLLTYVYTPLFLALAVLFGVWATQSVSGDPPSPWALAGLAILFAILALLALAVHSALHHRHRDHTGRRH